MYLFCVRHFNDVDHITPIVWKMNQDNYAVAVYCINPRYDIENDYRLKFLKEQGVTVESIYDAFDQKMNASPSCYASSFSVVLRKRREI